MCVQIGLSYESEKECEFCSNQVLRDFILICLLSDAVSLPPVSPTSTLLRHTVYKPLR